MSLSIYFRNQRTVISMFATALSIGVLLSPVSAQTNKPEKPDKSSKDEVAKVEWSKLAEAKELDPQAAIEKLDDTELNGRRIRLVEDKRRNGGGSGGGRRGRSRSSSSRSRSRSNRRRTRYAIESWGMHS